MILKCKAIAFDMDGTLIDSMGFWRLTNFEFLLRHRLKLSEELMNGLFFRSSRWVADTCINELGLNMTKAEIIDEFEHSMQRRYEEDIHAKDGAVELLIRLKEMGIRTCVATATPKAIAEKALEKYGLLPHLEFVVDAYEMGVNKSNPVFFEKLAERMGIRTDELGMFEDMLYAMEGAKKAGCKVFGIEDFTSEPSREAIREICDVYVESFRELL